MRKYDIINLLGRKHALRAYLEICTPSTGLEFARVDDSWFDPKDRLVYNCPETANDGLRYTARTQVLYSHVLVKAMLEANGGSPRYDIVFVDAWHTLRCALNDLAGAWRLLKEGGIMVVHDCSPTDPAIVSPEYQDGDWSGVTYQAYIEFLAGPRDADFCTVDTDYGCGVVRKLAAGQQAPVRGEELSALQAGWADVRDDDAARFAFFDRNRKQLLHLVSVEQFALKEGLDPASLPGAAVRRLQPDPAPGFESPPG